MHIDINCDLGEHVSKDKIGMDEQIMPYISSANIACGFHAGNSELMKHTIALALKYNVGIGAHPGYPDLKGFGRIPMKMDQKELFTLIHYQISELKRMTETLGGKLIHVKAHGALYNQASDNEEIALCIIEAVRQVDDQLIIFGLANSLFIELAKRKGMKTASEVFADRAYLANGSLVPRSEKGAIIHDAEIIANRAFELANGSIKCIKGEQLNMKGETICIHGDNPVAIESAKQIYKYLISKGIAIKNINS